MKRIGIIGSRRRNTQKDFEQLEKSFLEIYKDGDEIISGGCSSGGDRYAEILAKKYQVTIKIYYAQWDKLGKGAGFARNTYIARDSDVLISLVADDRLGGAEDTIKKAEKMGKKIILLTSNDSPIIKDPEPSQDIFSV
jgi:hypothetical protein